MKTPNRLPALTCITCQDTRLVCPDCKESGRTCPHYDTEIDYVSCPDCVDNESED